MFGIPENTTVTASCLIIRVTAENVLPEYVSCWLNSDFAKNYFSKSSGQATGVTIANVSKKVLEDLKEANFLLKDPDFADFAKEEINNFLSVTSIKCKYKDSSNKLQDKEIKFIPSSNKLFIKDVTASSGYEIGDYVDKVLISKENSDKIIDIKLKLSKNKQIYETKFTIDIINFKGEDI